MELALYKLCYVMLCYVVTIMKVNLSHGANSRGVNSKEYRTGTNHPMTMKGSVAEWSEHWTGNLVG